MALAKPALPALPYLLRKYTASAGRLMTTDYTGSRRTSATYKMGTETYVFVPILSFLTTLGTKLPLFMPKSQSQPPTPHCTTHTYKFLTDFLHDGLKDLPGTVRAFFIPPNLRMENHFNLTLTLGCHPKGIRRKNCLSGAKMCLVPTFQGGLDA